MLSKEETDKLRDTLQNAREEIDGGWTPEIDRLIRDVVWLAERLKDTNDELSKVHQELYKANKELADLADVE